MALLGDDDMVKSETQSVSLRSSPFLGQMATRAACWSRGTLEQGWFSPEQSRESLGSDDDDAWLGFLKMSAISLGSRCVRGGKDLVTWGWGTEEPGVAAAWGTAVRRRTEGSVASGSGSTLKQR